MEPGEALYDEKRSSWVALTNAVVSIVNQQITKSQIKTLSVEGRVKNRSSYVEKIKRKGYSNPLEQVTDACGIRIITYFPHQVDAVEAVLRQTFSIDHKNSANKDEDLGHNKVGYRSLHLVCSLGASRANLPEYENISEIKFEVQIRTVLQHAWAELAHDNSYKFSGRLPEKLQRTLNLQAGALELIDQQLEQLANNIEEYQREIEESDRKLNRENINTVSLQALYRQTIKNDSNRKPREFLGSHYTELIEEIESFGIKSISGLKKLIVQRLKTHWESEKDLTIFGFVRDILMYSDLDKYFSKSWEGHWAAMDLASINFLSEKYGEEKVRSLLDELEIDVEDE